jgi:hypothetical protein
MRQCLALDEVVALYTYGLLLCLVVEIYYSLPSFFIGVLAHLKRVLIVDVRVQLKMKLSFLPFTSTLDSSDPYP